MRNYRVNVNSGKFRSSLFYSFDARTKWPACTSIKTIRDQSACGMYYKSAFLKSIHNDFVNLITSGSCWAVSAASAMSDRLCVQSGGRIKVGIR